MKGMTVEQIATSTAEEERHYFTGDLSPLDDSAKPATMPMGTYRVMNGELFRLVLGPVPNLPTGSDPKI